MMGGFRLQMAHELSCGVLYALQSDDDTAKHGQSDCDDMEIDQTDQLGDDGDMDDEDDADENPNDIFGLKWGKDHYFKYLPRLKRMPYTEEQCPFEREFIRKVVKEMESALHATFSKVGLDALAIVKEVCTPCPGCEFALRQLPAKVASLEKRLQDFVEKTESALTNVLSASHVAATSAVQSQCTPDEDARFVKDLFSYLGEKDVVVVDCFRLGKPLVTCSASKPRLLKQEETGVNHFIDRRGPVNLWTVKRKDLPKDQFGFLSRRSACTQLLITLNNWTLNVDNGMKVDVVYTDIAKAFDTVSHSKLLLKGVLSGPSSKKRAADSPLENESAQSKKRNVTVETVKKWILENDKDRNIYVIGEGLAFRKKVPFCELEEKHGVDLGIGYKNRDACADFVKYIAQVQMDQLTTVLAKAKFLSIEADGTTDAANKEEELFMVVYFDRIVKIALFMYKTGF
eukprot:Em0004g295a